MGSLSGPPDRGATGGSGQITEQLVTPLFFKLIYYYDVLHLIANLSVSSFQPLAFYVAIWLVNLFPDSTRYTMPTLEIEGVWNEWDRDEETGDVFQSGGTISGTATLCRYQHMCQV